MLLSIIQGTLYTKTCHFLLTPSLFSRENHTATKPQLVPAVALSISREQSYEKVMPQKSKHFMDKQLHHQLKRPTFISLSPIFTLLTVFLKAWTDPHLGVSPCSTVPEGSACSLCCVHHPESPKLKVQDMQVFFKQTVCSAQLFGRGLRCSSSGRLTLFGKRNISSWSLLILG